MSEPARTPAPRYVLVSVDHDASHGGIGTYVQHVVPALAAAGWEVHLITRPGPTAPAAAHLHAVRTIDREPGFAERVTRLRTLDRIRPYRYGLWALAVAERLLTLPFEPAVVEFVDSRAEGIVALRSRRVRGAMPRTSMIISAHTPMGVIETMNGDDPTRFGRARYHGWERAALAAADGVITPSRALRDHLTLASPTLVSPHPFPVPPRPDDACDVRGEDVLVAASLQPAKGVEDWARSLNDVLRARPRTMAHLIGPDTPTGPGGGSMSDHLRTCLEPALRGRLRRHGPRSAAFVASLMRVAGLVVVPSRFDSFSFVAAEALAAACPVVVTEGVGVREHVPSLAVVPAGNVPALARAQIERLENTADARAEMLAARAELVAACAPGPVIATRTEWLATLPPPRLPVDAGAPDPLDEMRAFLTETERLERCAGGTPVGAPAS